jgi:hypothetical protein
MNYNQQVYSECEGGLKWWVRKNQGMGELEENSSVGEVKGQTELLFLTELVSNVL